MQNEQQEGQVERGKTARGQSNGTNDKGRMSEIEGTERPFKSESENAFQKNAHKLNEAEATKENAAGRSPIYFLPLPLPSPLPGAGDFDLDLPFPFPPGPGGLSFPLPPPPFFPLPPL